MLNNMNPNANNGNPNSGSGNNGGGSGGGINGIPAGAFAGFGEEDDFNPEDYLINYNEKFKNDPPILFRDAVIQQTLSCLMANSSQMHY